MAGSNEVNLNESKGMVERLCSVRVTSERTCLFGYVSLPVQIQSFINSPYLEREMELQHFSHYHSLIFFEDLEKNDDDDPCYGCLRQVSGPNYQSIDCLGVHLHQSCAELPRELWHPLHPQHPLLLIHEEEDCELCEGCNVYPALGFVYNCSHCNFNLDSKCASLPLTIEAENRDHPLTLMQRSVSFTCDACGKQGKGMFYSCAVCPFLVHLQCSSFPKIVKHIRHKHPLNLTDSLQLPNPPTIDFADSVLKMWTQTTWFIIAQLMITLTIFIVLQMSNCWMKHLTIRSLLNP